MNAVHLVHGGIMANYRCTAACRHCLYACSPSRSEGYITPSQAAAVCRSLRKGGCRSVHIGGGEPFLDFEGLLELVREIRRANISLDYIETNGYWAVPGKEDLVLSRLSRLLEAGGDALCISFDPFHAEYVPPERPLLLAQLCGQAGMGFFLWKQQYLPQLTGLDLRIKHTRRELEAGISPRYIWETADGYGLSYGGRAVNIQEEYCESLPVQRLLDGRPCRNLLSTDHFHVDLNGNFIPPGCTGIVLPLEQVVSGLPLERYPVFAALLSGGITGLYHYGAELGFCPREGGYPSKCALCFHLRHWLAANHPTPDLDPEHYAASLSYYTA